MSLGAASSNPSAAIVPATISDADGDDLQGQIQVGRAETVVSLLEPHTYERIIGSSYPVRNYGNATLDDPYFRLEFRPMGALSWTTRLRRDAIAQSLPNSIEVRLTTTRQVVGAFEILAWDDTGTGATISETDFIASVMLTYSGALPGEIDISSVPAGDSAVAIGASDGSTSGFGSRRFTKTAGQTRLLLTTP